jgi:hypothetical protein
MLVDPRDVGKKVVKYDLNGVSFISRYCQHGYDKPVEMKQKHAK